MSSREDTDGDPFHYTPGQSLGYLVRDTFRAFTRELEARIGAAAGVSIGHWYFLRALWEEDGLNQRELSRRVGMMEPTTVTAVNGMEARKPFRLNAGHTCSLGEFIRQLRHD